MKRPVLPHLAFGAILLWLALVPTARGQSFDPRIQGRAGTGLTKGTYNQSEINPAFINFHRQSETYAFGGGVGAFLHDEEEIVDELYRTQDDIDRLTFCNSNRSSSGCALVLDQLPDKIADRMATIDANVIRLDAGANFFYGRAESGEPKAFIVTTFATGAAIFHFVPNDRAELNEVNGGNDNSQDDNTVFRRSDLRSFVVSNGYQLTEFSLVSAEHINKIAPKYWVLGGAIKLQDIRLFNNTQLVGEFEEKDVLDKENIRDKQSVNIDLGGVGRIGGGRKLLGAFTVENLIPQTYDGPDGTRLKHRPVLTLAVGRQKKQWHIELAVDLTNRPGFALLEKSQYLAVGAEYQAGESWRWRGGYRTDVRGNVSNVYSLGFGVQSAQISSLDVALWAGSGDTLGFSLQSDFRF